MSLDNKKTDTDRTNQKIADLENEDMTLHKEHLKEIKPLDSVGCGFNPITKMVYLAYERGGYDLGNGVLVSDCVEDWFEGLSIKDLNCFSTGPNES